MKKIITCLFVTILVSTLVVSAQETNDERPIMPLYEVTCSGGGKHLMDPLGVAHVVSGTISNPGTKLISYGQGSQCRYCYLVLVSQYNPWNYYFRYVGNYDFWNPGYPVTGTVVTIVNGSIDNFTGNMSSDNFWAGFTFFKPY